MAWAIGKRVSRYMSTCISFSHLPEGPGPVTPSQWCAFLPGDTEVLEPLFKSSSATSRVSGSFFPSNYADGEIVCRSHWLSFVTCSFLLDQNKGQFFARKCLTPSRHVWWEDNSEETDFSQCWRSIKQSPAHQQKLPKELLVCPSNCDIRTALRMSGTSQ